jgi:carbon storage regulator CsrA
MLVLNRRIGEAVVIDGKVLVEVVEVNWTQRKVKLGFTAPREITIDRSEVSERRRKGEAGGES